VGEIITSNLENGWATSTNYTGAVDITTNPGSSSYADITAQSPSQSATGTSNWVNNVGAFNSSFTSMAGSVYNNNVAVGPENTGVTTLNMAIATPAIGGQSIDIIRRPVKGEDTANPAKLAERYYDQVSLRILLSDYASDGTCANTDDADRPGDTGVDFNRATRGKQQHDASICRCPELADRGQRGSYIVSAADFGRFQRCQSSGVQRQRWLLDQEVVSNHYRLYQDRLSE
jgi:hypothetical protein